LQFHRAITVFQAAERTRQLNKRVAARLQARLKREAAEAAAEAARREAEEGFMALKDHYGITQLSEVKVALACYAAMRSELDSRDPSEVQDALKLLGAVRKATGGDASSLSNEQLASAVGLAAVAQQQLGPNTAPKQLQEALAVAAACKQHLGADAAPQQLQEALAVAAVCKQHLGADAAPQQLQDALAVAAVCKQELGADASEQKLREALAAAAACQAELGHCNGIEVQQALAAASLVRQEFGEDNNSEQRLREALAAAALVKQEVGSYDRQQLQQRLALAAAAKQQLGGLVEPQRLRDALQLGDIAAQANIYQPVQLQQQLKLASAAASATPEEVAGALELHRAVEAAAGHASPAQVKAALKLQAAAEDEGITDAAGLSAALAAAAATAAAAAHAAPAQQQSSSAAGAHDDDASRLGAVVLAQGVTDAQELQTALSTYRHLRRDGHAFDARNARRACSMYAAAQAQGIADKRDFMAAAALYGVLREDGITSAGELRLAVAMYGAVREEGILDPEDLHAAIELASIARDEGLANSDELRSVLAASRGSYYYAPGLRSSSGAAAAGGGDANGHSAAGVLGSLRATASGENGSGSITEAMLQQQVAALTHQLDSEKAARSKYAKQLEQQAVEWMGQVKLLKEYIDSLRAKMPSHSSGVMPSLQLPMSPPGQLGGKGSGGGGETGRALRGLEGDWSGKAPLFDDDAAFIREVVDGEVLAPDMQVGADERTSGACSCLSMLPNWPLWLFLYDVQAGQRYGWTGRR
jgi:hypothetical protein